MNNSTKTPNCFQLFGPVVVCHWTFGIKERNSIQFTAQQDSTRGLPF